MVRDAALFGVIVERAIVLVVILRRGGGQHALLLHAAEVVAAFGDEEFGAGERRTQCNQVRDLPARQGVFVRVALLLAQLVIGGPLQRLIGADRVGVPCFAGMGGNEIIKRLDGLGGLSVGRIVLGRPHFAP